MAGEGANIILAIVRNIIFLILIGTILLILLPLIIVFWILYMLFGGRRFKSTFINFGSSSFGNRYRQHNNRPQGGTPPPDATVNANSDNIEAEFRVISTEEIKNDNK